VGSTDDEEKPQFASLRIGQSIETITLEEALELFRLPFSLGMLNDREVTIGIGRFGPYVKYGEDFISLAKGEDPFGVDMTRAEELINQKAEADAPIATYQDKPVTKGKGRFGPFIKWDDLFINVPRSYNFDALSNDDVQKLIEQKLEKEANRYILQFPQEKITVENGRWGPYIRFGKKMLKLGKPGKSKFTPEEAAALSIDEVKEMIVAQVPNAFDKKTAVKKAAPGKSASKKAASKKSAPQKSSAAARKK